MNYFTYKTPFGPVTISSNGTSVTAITLGDDAQTGVFSPNEFTNICATQILEYFAGKRSVFDVPIALRGTEFEKEVWAALQNIPYAQTRTSAELAFQIDKPNSYRTISKAAHACSIPIVVPVHRLVLASGTERGSQRDIHLREALRMLEKRFM